jgi:imidazoleglycerol-phosphate dehydratase
MRQAKITRTTNETGITIALNLDGRGDARLDYPIGFIKHMLEIFSKHGLFDLEVKAKGDLEVDQHHLVEDTGIVLGQCFKEALGDRRGIMRIGSCLYPMDETLARAAVDISGRPYLIFEAQLTSAQCISEQSVKGISGIFKYDTFQYDIIEDFWQGFVSAASLSIHLDILRGRSGHHKVEAIFKAAARALRQACEIDSRCTNAIPSTKGVLI